ncbi:MAG TPA: DUF1553 domain-containing protein [Gemmataceae bacterium]|nr:DUF1553 domain-containing protein [Gemmataceae bacterium]
MLRILTTAALFLGISWSHAGAAELELFPADFVLTGPRAKQQLLVLAVADGQVIGERTDQMKFASSNPSVATVDAAGIVRAIGDGEAILTATQDSKPITAKLHVTKTKEASAPSFRNDIIPLLTKVGCNSGACHGALAGKGGFKLSLRGYAPVLDHFVMTRQTLGRRVDPIEPAHSLVLLKPTMAVAHGGGLKIEVDSPDYQILADWIASGAPPPRETDPRIQRLEVFPPAAVLKPKDTLQIVVRAWYSDGHAEDVTRWVKFNSTEDLVATVDPEGRVRVAGYGEAAITLWYSNLVAVCRIASPLSNAVGPETFARADRHNAIDDLVLRKLAALHIPPSALCTDAEFIRRAFLDASGVLPTPHEVQRFLADSRPDKRSHLIDSLLQRPEFIDYWAYKWSDLFLISTRKLPQQDVWAFYQFIRQSVADNKPWDRFAREILTAHGSTLHNGAANYFVLHKDVSDLTEATSITFLGMSITCCRCHNHPLEKWTQDQYWSMANLFSRVALKNGDRTGEVSVFSRPAGDVLHPRRGVAMPPAPLDAQALPLDSPTDRRQYFADWLTAPENPYFARAIINRVWRNFLGRGLVEPEDDLRQTNPPTNEELFDALAKDFVAHGYDVKHLIRSIMNSATYQRSSNPLPGNAADDRFYSHYLIRRLSAEVALDAYSQVTGVPTPFTQVHSGGTGGLSAYGGYPLRTRALQLPDSQVASAFLDAFGRPERSQTCSCERQQDSSVSQALHLNNGQTLNDKLRAKNSQVEKWVQEKVNDEEAVRRLFLLALSREPGAAELQKFREIMAQATAEQQATRREVLEDLFWAVLTGREFLFNH